MKKFCKYCKTEHDIRRFATTTNSDDGYFPFCRVCVLNLRGTQIDNYERYFK